MIKIVHYFLCVWWSMKKEKCPKCGKLIKFYIKRDCAINFSLKEAMQTIICRNCKREIAYSVEKINSENVK